MKIIITGGSGFIGQHLVKQLLKEKNVSSIHIIDLKVSNLTDPKIIFHQIDIRNEFDFELVNNENTVCFHLAAVAKEPGFEWEEYFNTNYIGTKNVIKFCEKKNINTIIFTSTMMVYKAKEYQFSEEDLTTPDTAYGISKLLAEEALLAWKSKIDFRKLLIYRVAVVFGKDEKGNYSRLYQAIRKGLFFYIGKKTTIKSSIYVKDVITALLFPLSNKMQYYIYNLCIPQKLEIQNIVNTIKKTFNLTKSSFTIPYKLALISSYPFEILNSLGLKNSIHHRRIQKLYYSTNISSKRLQEEGFKFDYNLESAIEDWKKECNNKGLF